jgi:hypothetical protein
VDFVQTLAPAAAEVVLAAAVRVVAAADASAGALLLDPDPQAVTPNSVTASAATVRRLHAGRRRDRPTQSSGLLILDSPPVDARVDALVSRRAGTQGRPADDERRPRDRARRTATVRAARGATCPLRHPAPSEPGRAEFLNSGR